MLAHPNAAIRMDIQLLLIGFAFSALAIVAILTGRRQRAWVERDLYMGDLRTLSDIAFRRIAGPPFGAVNRLRKRGFLVKTSRGLSRVSLTGWVAVLLRHTSARRVETTSWDRGPIA